MVFLLSWIQVNNNDVFIKNKSWMEEIGRCCGFEKWKAKIKGGKVIPPLIFAH